MSTHPFRLIPPFSKSGLVHAIIETPRGHTGKINFNPQFGIFHLSKALPPGMRFPYDFGFIPNTIGGDGDPLDILVISQLPTFTGCLAAVRLLGVLEAEQSDRNKKKTYRNDRFIGVLEFATDKSSQKLTKKMREEIEGFFTQYNELQGKKFKSLGWHGAKRAEALIQKGSKPSSKKRSYS